MTDLKNGKTTLSTDQLKQVSEIIGVSIDYLLGRTDDPTPLEQKEKPPGEGELDNMLIDRLVQLTPEELDKVDAFVQGLIAAREV